MANPKDIVCNRCGSINDYRTEAAGPHIKAICNSCDRYIKFIPKDPTVIEEFRIKCYTPDQVQQVKNFIQSFK